MSYDEGLAKRIRDYFQDRQNVKEKKIFGGLCFLVSDHLCCRIVDDNLMTRVGPDSYKLSLQREHVREMDFTGKPTRGLIYASPEGLTANSDLND